MKKRGFTIVDILLWLIILILIGQAATRLDDVYQAYYRFDCYENHQSLDKLLWKINFEQQREIWDVLTAYPVQYPDDRQPQMVVIYKPRVDEYQHLMAIEPLNKFGPLETPICPLDRRVKVVSTINYMFLAGRWHCLFNEYHSE